MCEVTIEEIRDLIEQIDKLKQQHALWGIANDDWWAEKSAGVQMAVCEILLDCIDSRKEYDNFMAQVLQERAKVGEI